MEVGVCCVFFFHSIITYPCDDLYIYTCVCVCVCVCVKEQNLWTMNMLRTVLEVYVYICCYGIL